MSEHSHLPLGTAPPEMQVALSLGQSLTIYTTVDDVIQHMLSALVELTAVERGAVYVTGQGVSRKQRAVVYVSDELRFMDHVVGNAIVQQALTTTQYHEVDVPNGVQANFPLVQGDVSVGVAQLDFPDAETCTFYQRAVGVLLRFGSVAVVNAGKLEQLQMRVDTLERVEVDDKKPLERVRLLAMSELASAVAHQLNNPLTTILVDTEMMLADHTPDDDMYAALLAIYRAGRRAADVAHRLMSVAYSERNDGTPQEVNIAESIWETINVLQGTFDAKNVEVLTQLIPEVPPLFIEPAMLSDVWFNLFMNAKDELARLGGGKLVWKWLICQKRIWLKLLCGIQGEG